MALIKTNFARLGSVPYAAGEVKSVYAYATPNPIASVIASGYFNDLTKSLRKGDVIVVMASLDGTPTTSSIVVTSATGAATVTTAKESDPGGVNGAQTTISDLTAATGSASDTIADVGGAFNQTTLNNNFKSLAAKINAILANLEASGLNASS